MFVLIILMKVVMSTNNITSQQIEYTNRKSCETVAKSLKDRDYVLDTFCVQKD